MNLEELKHLAQENRRGGEMASALILGVLALAVITGVGFLTQAREVAVEDVPATEEKKIVVFPEVTVQAEAFVVYDLATHTVLSAKNEEVPLPLASITKLLTASAAVDVLANNTEVTVTSVDTGLSLGDVYSAGDLIRLALVASSNAAAQTLADTVASIQGSVAAESLAGAASALGLLQTRANNGSGLDESALVAGGYGSALDVARLAGSFVEKAPEFALMTTESSVSVTRKDGVVQTRKNTNPYVNEIPGLLLSKTGYTDLAGGNLVVVFDAGINHPIAVAALGSTEEARFTDVRALVEAARMYLGEYYSS